MKDGMEIHELNVARSGALIVRNLSMSVPTGEITVLLGPNGAGKSTLLDAIAGVIPVTSGCVSMGSRDVHTASRRLRVQSGISYVQQGRQIFPTLSVRANIRAAMSRREDADTAVARTLDIFPELEKRLDTPAGMLSGGEQQMIVLARSIAKDPKVLLIDELSLGLAPVVVRRFLPLLETLRNRGTAILLVEQYADAALEIGNSVIVLNHGNCVLADSCAVLRSNPQRLHAAYLGERR
ncbi:amino acid/amide ABC transporter ATP-binding protein 2 (HAAT family) [Paraburkholderia silvatlantica]|uniref:Amino acid/amide ABC transporter ATP-binding protein 2 (HAAT family) n=1 Tax=Paraburkholderia silvatlantica TaxID=321895 RepID=A0A2V4T7F4_9BURK|nr:ATP-binding cassette domain-containing protein [Paraburkholderia silvatlantica]PYE21479.1 amino acid/amide ABC transporter ATP-binding protein 2 (HAAT family) [Paraburkholderia silvatlantica]